MKYYVRLGATMVVSAKNREEAIALAKDYVKNKSGILQVMSIAMEVKDDA